MGNTIRSIIVGVVLRFALYSRVSDKAKQGDNYSIPSQLKEMHEVVVAAGHDVAYQLFDKESAFIDGLDRTELNKVLELARAGKIDVLMFYSRDRFTRDIADGVLLRRELSRCGVRLFCFWPTFTEVTSDMEIMNILLDFQSQQQSEKISEGARRGGARKSREQPL